MTTIFKATFCSFSLLLIAGVIYVYSSPYQSCVRHKTSDFARLADAPGEELQAAIAECSQGSN